MNVNLTEREQQEEKPVKKLGNAKLKVSAFNSSINNSTVAVCRRLFFIIRLALFPSHHGAWALLFFPILSNCIITYIYSGYTFH